MAIVIYGFSRSLGLGLLLLFIVAPLYFLLLTIMSRVFLEMTMALIEIASNTRALSAGSYGATSGTTAPPGPPSAGSSWGA